MSEHPDHEEPETDAAGAPRLAGVPLEKRRAIVVGASSGIGAALVERLAREGYRVAALARRGGALDELATRLAPTCARTGGAVLTAAHDVLDVAETDALFERLVRELGGLDLLIYASGIMPETRKDEFDTAKDLEQVGINLEGAIAWCNAAARFFQTQREGTIVGIGSIAGDRGRKGNPVYCTTKAAMTTYLEALRNRLSEVGVHVCTIKPGYVDTAMTQGLEKLFWLISPDEAARQILAAARNRVNVRYVPLRWWLVGTVIRSIPSFVFRKLNV
jgi:NAD(P)-dependent dehydrogenase (short-subunit alcohol dehydrogenase family)